MKKVILFSFLFLCKMVGHAQTFMPSFHPASYASSYNRTLTSIEVLAVGAGGGPGGEDGNYGAGGGSGGAVYTKITNVGAGTFNIAIGGGGGSGYGCVANGGAGAAGTNGGGAGGNAGGSGCSGGGGGGGGWSGVYNSTSNTYYVVAGGGAGGGGSNEGPANDVSAPGGGTTQSGGSNTGSMNGGAGAAYSGDGGGGGGGGGGWVGGLGQTPNSATYSYYASGGTSYTNPNYTTGTVYYPGNGSSGVSSNGNPGAAVTVTNASDFGYTNNKGGGGQGTLVANTYGASGSDGIVIIRYYGPQRATGGVVTTVNGYTVHTFTSAGTLTFKMLPVKGAMAHYMASEFASGQTPTVWHDQSGNGYDASINGGVTVGTSSKNLNNNMVIKGTTSSYITFPVFTNHNWTNTSKYTLFIVSRYTNTTNMRILTDYSTNWLTSHWWGDPGVAHHNGWITAVPNTAANFAIDDWVLFTDQNNLARANGIDYTSASPGAINGFGQLVINHPSGTWSGEKSTFEIAELIVYPRTLNSQEINFVETYLSNKYGVAGYNDGLMLNLDASNKQSYDGNGTSWTDLISGNQIQWSSSVAPVFKIDNGVSVFSTTPTIGTTRAISSSGYTNLRDGNGAYSVMAIFKPNSLTAGKVLVSMGSTSTCDAAGSVIHPIGIGNGGTFAGGACGTYGNWNSTAGVTPTTSRFWCVTTTFTGGASGTETIYVDGVYDKSATASTNNTTASVNNRFTVGWNVDAGANFNMDANVAVILYYNRALSASEVLALYNKYKKKLNLP